MQTILLATTSPLKYKVVADLFPTDKFAITTVNCDSCGLPPQPYNCAQNCAKVRLDYSKKKYSAKFDYYIAIENGIDEFKYQNLIDYKDVCHVLIEHNNSIVHSCGNINFIVPVDKMEQLFKCETSNKPSFKINGFIKTIGDIFHEENSEIDTKNWVMSVYGQDRYYQIEDSVKEALKKLKSNT